MKPIAARGIGSLLLMLGVLASSGVASAQISGGISIGLGGGYGSYGSAPWLSNPFFLPHAPILAIVMGITYWLLAILGFIGIIGFVIAGIRYLLAFGNDKDAETAKAAMKYSIYGVIVALIGFVIIQAATTMLSAMGGF